MAGDGLATIKATSDTNEKGREQSCIFATCDGSGTMIGPVWGDGEASVLRALAMLSETCACGAKFHIDKDNPPPVPDWEKRRDSKKKLRATEEAQDILVFNAEIVLDRVSYKTPAGWTEQKALSALRKLFDLWAPDLNLKLPTKATKSPNGTWTAVTEK